MRTQARIWVWLLVAAVIAVFATSVWFNDYITLQGERTVYTAACQQGTWIGDRCTGKLVAGERHRFRALKAHNEVFFWIAGDRTQPSGRFTDCVIADGRNWSCKPNADAPRSITLALARGRPVIDPTANTRPFHAVSKLKWVLLDYGIPVGDTAVAP
jgi:hypothetical protein